MHHVRRPGVISKLTLTIFGIILCIPAVSQPINGTLDFGTAPGERLEVPHDASLNPTHAMTVEAWVYVTPVQPESCRSLVGKGYVSSYWFGICETTFRTYTRGIGSSFDGGQVPTETWTHLAMTTDGTTRYHYVNGQLAGTFAEPDPGAALPSNLNAFMIGNDANWDYAPDGRIDEVRLWNVARSQSDIQRTMRVAIDAPQTGLVSVWHLDGNGDDAIGSNDGTKSGAVFAPQPIGGFCAPSDTVLCLGGGRFEVSITWATDSDSGSGHVVPGYSADSGLFWFFNENNWELMIKALNGCGVNGHRWVFTAATTNVQYDVTVKDLYTNDTAMYHNPLGVSAPAVTDTSAFNSCP